jgi:hypothetical protein
LPISVPNPTFTFTFTFTCAAAPPLASDIAWLGPLKIQRLCQD